METIEQKKRRLAGKLLYLDAYINTLNRITLKKVDPSILLSVVETDRLLESIGSREFLIDYETTLDFCDKKYAWETIRKVFGNSSLYIYLEHVRECGLLPLESIDLFNIDFDFEDDPGELIVLVSNDCLQEVVLDFYEEDDVRKIDIEIRSAIINDNIHDSLGHIKTVLGDFILTLRKREKRMGYAVSQTAKNAVNCNFALSRLLFQYVDGYCIRKDDREIVFKLALLDYKYLQFAKIDDVIIAVDIRKTNEANEWDIINYETKYVITRTFESFFSNKVWAWLDRKRTIWKEEKRKSGDDSE
jgi:hypothetical protein